MSYTLTVKAALCQTGCIFDLADALLAEIPVGPLGQNTGSLTALSEVREAIIAAGGEPKAVSTLGRYREIAAWVAGRWVPGRSFSDHAEGKRTGVSFEAWASAPLPPRRASRNIGRKALDAAVQAEIERREAEAAAKTALVAETVRAAAEAQVAANELRERLGPIELAHPDVEVNRQLAFAADRLTTLITSAEVNGNEIYDETRVVLVIARLTLEEFASGA